MSVNREIWQRTFNDKSAPPWPCPTCRDGLLTVIKKTLVSEQQADSRKLQGCIGQYPDQMKFRFSVLFICTNPNCEEIVSVCGDSHLAEVEDFDGNAGWVEFYQPTHFNPAPPIFTISRNCPEVVSSEINKCFSLFWSDYPATSNRIRVAIEKLLNHQNIAKTKINIKKRKREKITLHHRIEAFKAKNSDLAESLLAIKWLGNSGSHDSNISLKDIFDAFDILEHTINELYESRQKKVKKLTKAINKRKGPV